jgi:hypothetical protein
MKGQRRFLSAKIAFVLFAALLASSLFAGAKEVRLEGTVKEIGKDFVTIETAAHKELKVKITSATTFLKDKKASTLSEMKTGNHVVFRAVPSADSKTASAEEATAKTQKDSLSLGLGFTAVQASY